MPGEAQDRSPHVGSPRERIQLALAIEARAENAQVG